MLRLEAHKRGKKRIYRSTKPAITNKLQTQTNHMGHETQTIMTNPHTALHSHHPYHVESDLKRNNQSGLMIGGFFQADYMNNANFATNDTPDKIAVSFEPPKLETNPIFENATQALADAQQETNARKDADLKIYFALEQLAQIEKQRQISETGRHELKNELEVTTQKLNEAEYFIGKAINEKNALEKKNSNALEHFYVSDQKCKDLIQQLDSVTEQLKNIEAENFLIKEELQNSIVSNNELRHTQELMTENLSNLNGMLESNIIDKEEILKTNINLELNLDEITQKLSSFELGYEFHELNTISLEEKLVASFEKMQQMENDLLTLQEKLGQADANETRAFSKLIKVQNILEKERELRMLTEQKVVDALEQAKASDFARQIEENVRKFTEEKAEKTVVQTGLALARMFSKGQLPY